MKRLDKITYLLWAIAIALILCLVDKTAEYVATALYPIKEQVVVNRVEKVEELSVREYVLGEVERAGIDKYEVYNLISCESSWNTQNYRVNYHARTDTYSIDRGLWQINSYWHSEVSPSCAYDYKCATKESIRILKERGFSEWTCGN